MLRICNEQKMNDPVVYQLQSRRENLGQQLQQLNIDFFKKYSSLQQLGDLDQEDQQLQIAHLRSHLENTKQHLQELIHTCQEATTEKNKKNNAIQEFELKHHRMKLTLEQEQNKLKYIQTSSQQVEQAIHECRDYYEQLQEQIHSLDGKIDNLKKYGSQEVPESIMRLCEEKKSLHKKLNSLDQQIISEKRHINQMVNKQEFESLQGKVEELRRRCQQMEKYRNQNEILMHQNIELNHIKGLYEWNPNLEMKGLQENLAQQELKIVVIQKEITAIHKKSTECSHKIQLYHSHVQDPNICLTEKGKNRGKGSLFKEITEQLGKQYDRKVEDEGARRKKHKEGEGKTYKLDRKVGIVQFWIVTIALMGLTFWCYRVYKK